MATKSNPGKYDCYANANPDEPMFVLLARDITAPETIRRWCGLRMAEGKNKAYDEQINEALMCADAMEKWLKDNR